MRAALLLLVPAVLFGCGKAGDSASGTTTTTGTTGSGGTTVSTSAVASTAPAMTGKEMQSTDKKLSVTLPNNWTWIDPSGSTLKEIAANLPDKSAGDMIIKQASSFKLMAMDFTKAKTGFADNVNIVDSGAANIKSDSDLEQIFSAMESQFGTKAKLDHKLIKFPIGATLCYWGTVDQGGGQSNDLIGYAFGAGGNAYVVTFSMLKGNLEKERQMTESVMQTLKVN